MMNHSDTQLVDLSLDGNERAFECLVERHYHSVYGLSYKWCRIKEDAEEITQEVFIKLTRKLYRFNRKSSFKTWLYRIVINTAKDFSRKNAIRRSREAEFANERTVKNGNTPLEALQTREIYDAMDRLPAKQKAALMLVMTEGMNHREAAAVLGCSETTVSWRIHQARKKLKQLVTGWQDNEK
jgi:RNA polymerase sigma-70 factor (ECF subfamily)